jgi:hypothetical protein
MLQQGALKCKKKKVAVHLQTIESRIWEDFRSLGYGADNGT